METDIKEKPWFSNGFPAFSGGWQKTPMFWNTNHQEVPSQSSNSLSPIETLTLLKFHYCDSSGLRCTVKVLFP